MGYGGIDEVEFDDEHGFFYVHREAGYWNRYHIDKEPGLVEWIIDHRDEIEVYELEYDNI